MKKRLQKQLRKKRPGLKKAVSGGEVEILRQKLSELQEELQAIRRGEVDAILSSGPKGDQVFTLKSAEHPYRILVESMSEGAATLNFSGDILYCNNRLAELLQIPLEKLIGSSLSRRVAAKDADTFSKLIKKGRTNSGGAEISLQTQNGELRYVHISLRKLEMDTMQGISAVITDLTQVKKNREYLMKIEQQLSEAKRLSDIGMLAATVAHELRNPLAAIGAAAYNIKRQKGCEVERPLFTIEKKIKESDQIINNLLFYSRVKAPQREKVRIYTLLEECILSSRERYPNVDTVVKERFEPLKETLIECDPLQIREVFVNVLNNSFDAMPPHGGRIVIEGRSADKGVTIQIIDNGGGIDKAGLERLFEPFFTRKSKGTGLGLTVSQQIVHLHKGNIKIESKKGAGTTVTVWLPLIQEQ